MYQYIYKYVNTCIYICTYVYIDVWINVTVRLGQDGITTKRSCLLVAPQWPNLELTSKMWVYSNCGSQYNNKGGIIESDSVLVYIPTIHYRSYIYVCVCVCR